MVAEISVGEKQIVAREDACGVPVRAETGEEAAALMRAERRECAVDACAGFGGAAMGLYHLHAPWSPLFDILQWDGCSRRTR